MTQPGPGSGTLSGAAACTAAEPQRDQRAIYRARLLACGFLLIPPCVAPRMAHAQAATGDDQNGRDFPKTLTLDEPGVDDEVSLPTFQHLQNAPLGNLPGTAENDIAFEIDKRVTGRLQMQITGGYRSLADVGSASRYGWDNVSLPPNTLCSTSPRRKPS